LVWRPGWHVGRRAYTFHITFDDESGVDGIADLRRLTSHYQKALTILSGLDVVPLHRLHLTMQNVGFTNEVSEADARAVLLAARHQCSDLHAFELTIGEARVSGEGVTFRPTRADPVCEVRGALRAAIRSVHKVVPEAPEHVHGFDPHISIAYCNRDAPFKPVAEALKRVDVEAATVTVRAAKLIVLDRDDCVYRWSTFGDVALGGG
jgi:hypothetical protein